MTPSTWLTVIAFFLFVAPGLLFDQLSAQRKVKRRESTFTEISRVAGVSTICSGVAFLLFAVFGAVCTWRKWKLLPVPSAMIKQGSNYVADNLTKVAISSAVFVALSLLAAWLLFEFVHHGNKAKVYYDSAWRLMMREHAPESASVHVRATLSDGTVWFGRVHDYSPDLEAADRELVLQPPIAVKPKSDSGGPRTLVPFPAKWAYVALPGSEIRTLAVSYGPPDPVPDSPPEGTSNPDESTPGPGGA
ncbi:DUF6338 family protein [Nocardia sp. NPDC051911]|uniref:DUF6338 family protein n=1 Tax=Nocardia sp. NPDC051911 TaxID=3154648 RepID=UPI00341B6B7B